MFLVALLLSLAAPVMAQRTMSARAMAAQVHGPLDAAEMEAFVDSLLSKQLEENHIPGAAVALVKDGKLFFAKGYGYANVEKQIPVVADQTVFKIGSVTNLFKWTAAMQLVERGELNLDADVSTYLDFHIEDTYPQPIALRHLMTHTARFEDLHVDMVTLDEKAITPPGAWQAFHVPARLCPPGELVSYSNYGSALAGYIVARVSGEAYSHYVKYHILDPLGTKSVTTQWPTPQNFHEKLSA